ncbi:CoA pyrophosphatase [Amaricoccus sp.]|uniref:CoA pyrophosphatase n=1 Tax=Amaricoccus sp. TaxID=1872485 RepID=UPI001B51B50E|nr:CoA pyrophosphatase [Amaricoccus sp.]MBP7002370.1 CoA pyrophosphatase [Amaricoccus sp.]
MDRSRLDAESIALALAAPEGGSSDFDLDPEMRPPGVTTLRPASVLVALVERGPRLAVILTRRAARLAHHPGQVAFPGGKQDPGDPDAVSAALREAEEEIGLPRAAVRILGALAPHDTVTSFRVTPFVGLVTAAFIPRLDRAEVDEIFEVPLDFLLAPSNLQVHGRRWHGRWRQYYAIPYGPHYIWGATARMLKSLADRLAP